MGQQEVYIFLKENKNRWFLSKEVSKQLGVSIGSVTNCLKKLRESKAINFKGTKRKNQYGLTATYLHYKQRNDGILDQIVSRTFKT